MNPRTKAIVNGLAIVGVGFAAIRLAGLLPREEQIKRTMREQGLVYGIDWQWKEPADWRERFFGWQEPEYLR